MKLVCVCVLVCMCVCVYVCECMCVCVCVRAYTLAICFIFIYNDPTTAYWFHWSLAIGCQTFGHAWPVALEETCYSFLVIVRDFFHCPLPLLYQSWGTGWDEKHPENGSTEMIWSCNISTSGKCSVIWSRSC